MKVYLDNAATTYPKPPSVHTEMLTYFTNIGASPGRGSYSSALESSRLIYKCRESLCELFNFSKPENVIFTYNVTASLNMLIKGVVKKGFHVITTSMEHNSSLRPLFQLKDNLDIDLDILQCDNNGILNIDEFENLIKPTTKLVVINHASNIIGSIQPIEAIGRICSKNDIFFIIDAAQTAGVIDIDFEKVGCSALAFTGHKSLLGPPGIGGFLVSDKLSEACDPIITGGTGSLSSSVYQPSFLPDKFESGTMNTPGVMGLLAGIEYINSKGMGSIKEIEDNLCDLFINSILNMDKVKLYGLKSSKNRTAVISLNFNDIDSSEVSYILDSEFGIMTRTGLHCAPLAHKTIGTYPEGTLRFSIGPFNDKKDITYTIDSLYKILRSS
ncbi:aminotransferase class V-fold PLP-dependent enzyme [Clostridium algidicarnis]|uniref:aminotransferase class V-fold PLP-dependent enzyme n=1 Tax=Clostridium algidicarnis TaxID=37659 RepID=UPI001C0C9CB2|nr:aminotransferase class V-fold PLP-dependent enzyme [Clostridium algidicarnis]MBU3210231.1 aminotransferase class V-fold PLP-dependent enzyme [Clostridium algidicarnis]MBU3228698.1 aminotransferase class V-fold PLP-dependent enzyme [Clostridium algidicarnis]MBU3251256.1 aminotransferase class V-fold PLP-dependent enzyme [Clostridium algidicarnis]